jgi:hypothetical protein
LGIVLFAFDHEIIVSTINIPVMGIAGEIYGIRV